MFLSQYLIIRLSLYLNGEKFLELLLLVVDGLIDDERPRLLDVEVGHVQLHVVQSLHDALRNEDDVVLLSHNFSSYKSTM